MTFNQQILDYIKEKNCGRYAIQDRFGLSDWISRKYIQYARKIHSQQQKKILKNNVLTQNIDDNDLSSEVFDFIKTKDRTLEQVCNKFNIPPKTARLYLQEIKQQGFLVNVTDNVASVTKTIEKYQTIDIKKHGQNQYAIGVLADTHIGSKYERLDVLNSLYKRFQQAGVKEVYHAGNWIDGEARFNIYDLYVRGINSQIKNFIDVYPTYEGVKTYIVSGDDHQGWYVQRQGVNIGQLMQMMAERDGRTDLIDAGHMEADFKLKQERGSSILRVMHPGGGSSYALSYTSQKYVESLQGGQKPQIVIAGHYHKFDWSYPRQVHIIQPGCVEDQTPFMRKKKIQAMVGGCILWIKQADNGIITSLKVEWMPYYDKSFYKYKWSK